MQTKKVPMRMCLGCNEMKPKRELVRIVKTKEGDISLDPTGKKAGRGAYICRNDECLAKTVKTKRLSRTFGCEIPDEVFERLRKELAESENAE